MNEKRKYSRYACLLKAKFIYFEGDPDSSENLKGTKGKGRILDISQGGIFIATNSKVSINQPIEITFKTAHKKYTKKGTIIRTGLIKNNPSDTVIKYENLKIKENSYLAVQFEELLGFIIPDELS